jgi:hypothetical protein
VGPGVPATTLPKDIPVCPGIPAFPPRQCNNLFYRSIPWTQDLAIQWAQDILEDTRVGPDIPTARAHTLQWAQDILKDTPVDPGVPATILPSECKSPSRIQCRISAGPTSSQPASRQMSSPARELTTRVELLHHLAPKDGLLLPLAPKDGLLHHLGPKDGLLHHLAPKDGLMHHLAPKDGLLHHLAPKDGLLHHLAPK